MFGFEYVVGGEYVVGEILQQVYWLCGWIGGIVVYCQVEGQFEVIVVVDCVVVLFVVQFGEVVGDVMLVWVWDVGLVYVDVVQWIIVVQCVGQCCVVVCWFLVGIQCGQGCVDGILVWGVVIVFCGVYCVVFVCVVW